MRLFSKEKKISETQNKGFWKSVYEGEVSGKFIKRSAGGGKFNPGEHIKNVIIPRIKERGTAIRAAVVFLVSAGIILYAAAGHRAVDKEKELTKILNDRNSDITRQLDETSSELDSVSEEFNRTLTEMEEKDNIIAETDTRMSDLIEANEEQQQTIIEQQQTIGDQQNYIDEQQEIIDNQQQIIDEQQNAIDLTDEAIREIADSIGANISSRNAGTMYNALEKIRKSKEIITNTISDPEKVKQYCELLDEKAAEVNEDLKRYPDYEPAPGKISYTYGNHTSVKNGVTVTTYHRGLDIHNPSSPPVKSAAYGKVTEVHLQNDGTGLGIYVRINHGNGYSTLYGHLASVCVTEGQIVEKGQQIGIMGKTGAATGIHVHIEVYIDGQRVDPITYFDYEFM
ncbi:MAG: peptidoglycan DD-metalloendopeptidase family protein [Clostridia bacterium]|nr:peptidoglycan DD-metalloendopeptidase family protein [Clostridia bacterium]